jgi:NAD(P)-dependent dehydrogenase (short-subunit alcohol dehydrogenase family)
MLLKDRVAIITGAASPRGIGKATARLFVQEGARVAIFDLDAAAASNAATSLGPGNIGLACDVRDPARCKAAVEEVIKHFGAIDILVNNAGVSQPDKLMDISQENFDLVIDVSLRGSLNMVQAVAPGMQSRRRGSTSRSARWPLRSAEAYSAARIIQPPKAVSAASRNPWLGNSQRSMFARTQLRREPSTPTFSRASSRTRKPALSPTFRSAASERPKTSPMDVSISPQISRLM